MAENLNGNWVLVSGLSPSPFPPRPEITAEFRDGTISGTGGCNRYFGDYRIKETSETSGYIDFGAIATTRMSCGEYIDSQERTYFQALEMIHQYEITDEGQTLIMPYPSPERYLKFERQ